MQAPWGVAATTLVVLPRSDARELDTFLPQAWPISGFARDEEGNPLAGVRVETGMLQLFRSNSTGRQLYRTLPGERHIDWDESAADGSFRLITWGRHLEASATAPDGTRLFGGFDDGGGMMGIRLRGGPERRERADSPVTVTLRPAAQVGGIVRDGAGRAQSGVTVFAMPLHFNNASIQLPVVTGADGRFRVDAVPAEEVELMARAESWPYVGRTRLRLHPGEARDGVEIVMGGP
jgi:hypothetical protein